MRAVNAAPNVRSAADPAAIAEAAELLRAGRLVGFPTETVYGLGANALDPAAVARIFEAKGRPATNPLIVHVASVEAARELATNWPEIADRLTARFWPGPLTLVVEKGGRVPDIVTANGPTVGLRVPDHPAALALLQAAGVPIAAPSANRSEEVSPTTARHVFDSLGDRVDLILDGGPTNVGIESTVLDVTCEPPRILRPGMVSEKMLHSVVGSLTSDGSSRDETIARSPGQTPRHYAPRARLEVVPAAYARMVFRTDGPDGELLLWGTGGRGGCGGPRPRFLPRDPSRYAAGLYAALRDMDAAGIAQIHVEEPPSGPEWAAIHDRLRRAATPKEDAS